MADHDGLEVFYAGLSDESRRTRFLGWSRGIGSSQSTWFCSPDHEHREGFVAVVDGGTAGERIVGHVCIEPDDPSSAEVAIAVAEAYQGRGIGTALVEAAVAWARSEGIRILTATMLASNAPIQRLLTGLPLRCATTPLGCGIVEIRIDLENARAAA